MASITDLVLHLSTGRCIAWVGSGPSIAAGLPGWRGLANEVLESCRRKQRRGFERIEAYYREQKYPEMFDEVERHYGREHLVDICRSQLEDPGSTTSVYEILARLDFLAYFTTNYDDLLFRHIEQCGIAIATYRNSSDDLSAVDIDIVPALVKLHGDLSPPENAILTRGDYRRLYRSGDGKAYQTFLQSYLSRDRFLFVGYSMNDPEVLQLQETIQADLRRHVKSIAILANATDAQINRWNLDYNIDILPYRQADQDHSELVAILESVDKVLSTGQSVNKIDTTEELKRAEALYLWYRFSPDQNGYARIDALQSVILSVLADSSNGISLNVIQSKIASNIGSAVAEHYDQLEESLGQLIEAGWLIKSNNLYRIGPENLNLMKSHERRFEEMMSAFERQVTIDSVKLFGVEEHKGPSFARLLVETMIDIFQTRGRELLRLVFEQGPISRGGALELIETVWRRANHLEDPRDRPTFVRLVLSTMFEPKGIYGNVLNYFAKAFFCIQALGADKTVNEIVAEVIQERTLLIDANILIPLAARSEDRNQFVHAVVEACRAANMSLYTTEAALDEVRRHALWALKLVETFGNLSAEVLYAARGEAGYGLECVSERLHCDGSTEPGSIVCCIFRRMFGFRTYS